MRRTPDCPRKGGIKLREKFIQLCLYWIDSTMVMIRGWRKTGGMGMERRNTIDNVHLEGISSAWLVRFSLKLTNA